jgi:ABC-type multidrug transport system ATPase subunit
LTSTDGLSLATTKVLRAVRVLADMKATVLAALLQPSYEVFSLFDNVIILTQGQVAFFGTRQEAMDHFMSLGYSCSENTNPAEFLRERSSVF